MYSTLVLLALAGCSAASLIGINPNSLNVPLDTATVALAKNAQLVQQAAEGTRNILGGGIPAALPADTHEVAAGKIAHAVAIARQKASVSGAHVLAAPVGIASAGVVAPALVGNGLLARGVVGNGLIANGIVANGLIGNGVVANGLIGNGIVANGLIGNGLIGNGLVAGGLIGNGLIGNGLIGNGLVAGGLIGNGHIGNGVVAAAPLNLGGHW